MGERDILPDSVALAFRFRWGIKVNIHQLISAQPLGPMRRRLDALRRHRPVAGPVVRSSDPRHPWRSRAESMSEAREQRHLAAILAADVVGDSRLVERDEGAEHSSGCVAAKAAADKSPGD